MKSLFAKSTVIVLGYLLLGIMLYGCCGHNLQITKFATMRAFHIANTGSQPEIDSVKMDFALVAQFQQERVQCNIPQLISSSYATSVSTNFVNELVPESFMLYLDKDFVFFNDTIHAGEDILPLAFVDTVCQATWNSNLEVKFTTEFMSHALFGKETYEFFLIGKTTDNIKLAVSKKLFMDL